MGKCFTTDPTSRSGAGILVECKIGCMCDESLEVPEVPRRLESTVARLLAGDEVALRWAGTGVSSRSFAGLTMGPRVEAHMEEGG